VRQKITELEPILESLDDMELRHNFEVFFNVLKAACVLSDPIALLSHLNAVATNFQKLRKESKLWITSVIDYVLYLLSRYQTPERLNFFWTIRNELQRVLNCNALNTPNNEEKLDSPSSNQSAEEFSPSFSGFNISEFLMNNENISVLADDLTSDIDELI